MKQFFALAITALTLAGNLAHADGLWLGVPGYGGNGCPQGTASVTLSPDQKQLSVLFDQYIAEAGASVGKALDRKACNLSIPVHVPNGYSISILEVDYRGFVSVPVGGQAQFNVEYFFAGQTGPKYTKTFQGGTNDSYSLGNTLLASALVWSTCGADVNLRVNTNIMARTNAWKQDALATVDSADVSAGLIYHIQMRKCP